MGYPKVNDKFPIILLDLNYTLVANSTENRNTRPYQKKILKEKYREWLVHMLREYYVIIITARPNYQKRLTIESFKSKLDGWIPHEMYFQEENDVPHIAKEKILLKYIFQKHEKVDYLAIESNPKTKVMYEKYGIPSVSVYNDESVDLKRKLEEISK